MVSPEALKVLRKVMEKIKGVAVRGLALDEDLFQTTVPAHDEFMATLQAWDEDKTDTKKAKVRKAAAAFIGAWREASVEYQSKRS